LSQKGHGISILSTNHPNNFPYFEKDDFVEYNDFSKTEGIWKDSKKNNKNFFGIEKRLKN